jgi:hypothetical protein
MTEDVTEVVNNELTSKEFRGITGYPGLAKRDVVNGATQ